MWSERTSPTFLFVIAASIAAHVAFIAVLPPADATTLLAPRAPTVVTIEPVAPPSPPPPPPVPEPPKVEPPVPPESVAARLPVSRAPRPPVRSPAAPRLQVAATEPPASPETPVDFSGVTLSNEGASWSSPTGNGAPMTGPIAASEPMTRPGPVLRRSTGASTDRVVAVGDLSRPPRAPDLDAALAANYPSEARRAGTTGKAVVRARILADGTVGTIRIVSESAPGFGAACRRTLAGSRWQPPLDSHDDPVITDISYTCTFAVAR